MGQASWHGTGLAHAVVPQLPCWPRCHLREAACLSIMEQRKLQLKCLSALLCVALMRPRRRCRLGEAQRLPGGEEGAGGDWRGSGGALPWAEPRCWGEGAESASDHRGWHRVTPEAWPCLVVGTSAQ